MPLDPALVELIRLIAEVAVDDYLNPKKEDTKNDLPISIKRSADPDRQREREIYTK